ncbi:MAG: DNA adenine methylase, partial [Dehalococcoidia bacterium]|nr:DNA adenine methylase [Dehalococcoidia bacterium]
LDSEGRRLMLSNSDTPLVRDLYAGYALDVVRANRLINSNRDGRLGFAEVIIRNYDTPGLLG